MEKSMIYASSNATTLKIHIKKIPGAQLNGDVETSSAQ
jgi:hypothetical protein